MNSHQRRKQRRAEERFRNEVQRISEELRFSAAEMLRDGIRFEFTDEMIDSLWKPSAAGIALHDTNFRLN